MRFKPSNVLVERGAALVRTCVSSDTPTTVVPLFLPGEPARDFYPRCEHPRRADRQTFFGKSRVLSLPRAAPPYDDVASTNI